MTITQTNHPLATENNLAALNRLADELIEKGEAAYKAGDTGEAMKFYLELDGVEKRRGELDALETRRANAARTKAALMAPANPMRHQETQDEGGRQGSKTLYLPGQAFTSAAEYKALVESRAFDNSKARLPEFGIPLDYSLLQLKTLVVGNSVSGAGAFVMNDELPGYVNIRPREYTFLDIVSRVRTSSDTVDWIKQVTRTNNAATVAEATATTGTSGTKPESAINYERVTQAVETVATWIPITTRALADAPQMQDIINGELLIMLGEELEDQIISGDGTSPNLRGLLNSSILTQATASGTNNLDTLLHMATKIEVSGKFSATDIVLNPVNWETLRLLRENSATATLGAYLMGPPSLPGPMTVFGIPVVKSQGLTAGTGIVGNFTPITHTLFDRQQSVIRMGYIDDQFVRNMLTLLGELRAAFAVKRPYAFCSVTGLV